MNEHMLAQLLDQAQAHGEQGRWLHASQAYLRILAEHPERADVSLKLAAVYVDMGRPDIAEHTLLEALGRDRYNADLLYALGAVFYDSGDLDSARYYFEKLLPHRLPQVHCMLGRVYERRDDAVAAERHYRVALELDAEFRDARLALVRLLLAAGDGPRALAVLDETGASDSGDPELRFLAGIALSLADRREDALACFRELLRQRPRDPRAAAAAARLLIDLGRLDEAEELLLRAAGEQPEQTDTLRHVDLLLLLGTVALHRADKRRATRYFRRVLELDPANVDALKFFATTGD